MQFSRNTLFLLIILLSLSSISFAATTKPSYLSFEDWVERVKKQALNQGISFDTVELVFANVQEVQIYQNPESNIPTEQFLNFTLSNQQVQANKQRVADFGDVLFEIKHLFGVNPEVIIALQGINNIQKRNKPLLSAIDLLTTLSYKHPTNKKIKKELFQALKIIEDGQVSTHRLISNFEGNLGSTPFNPTTFRDYAIDYDGDGEFDIWQNHADIFASTANYLGSIGWETDETWGFEIKLPLEFRTKFIGLNQQRSVTSWQKLGIRLPDGSDLPASNQNMGSIIQPSTKDAKSYLVFNNFFALLRWKRSQQFAFAVGMMMDKIKQPNNMNSVIPIADVSQ